MSDDSCCSALPNIIIAIGPTFLWVALILFFILFFQKPIRSLLTRTTGFEAFGAKLLADRVGLMEGRSTFEGAINQFMQNDLGQPYTYHLRAVPMSIYFFSHDLMLTYAGLLTGARAEVIAFTLQSALNHVGPLGLTDSPVHKSMLSVAEKLRSAADPMDEADRSNMAQKIWLISRFVGDGLIGRMNWGPAPVSQ